MDKSTYCDYQLTFLLHIHGLPLSAKRAFLILMVSGCPGAALLGGWGSPPPSLLTPACPVVPAGVHQRVCGPGEPLHHLLPPVALHGEDLQLLSLED